MNIRKIRSEKNISQKELADMIGSSQMNICRYEIGIRNPSLQTAKAIAKALDCTIDELLEEPKEETE